MNKKFTFINPDTKEEEEVLIERWIWGVVYKDDTELHQFDRAGTFHRLSEIKQSEVKLWILYCPSNPKKRIDIVVPEGARLIHKYRKIRPFYLEHFVQVYLFGYRTGKSEYKYHYNYILPDDRIVQSTEDNIDLTLFNIQ